MSTIKLPPLPEPRIVSYQADSTLLYTELRTYDECDMTAYAEEAVRQALAAQVPVAWLYHDGKPGVVPDPRDMCTSVLVTMSRQPWCRNETPLAIIPEPRDG
jgi:hypothetical protein